MKHQLIFVVLCSILAVVYAEIENPIQDGKRYAYASIHYEGTPRDYEYLLGLRVMIQSIKLSKSKADIVILTSDNVSPETIATLHADGAKTYPVQNIKNPFLLKQPRFLHTLNKLHLWNMTQYERIIYMDSDTIVIPENGNVDELFLCGHFCMVYQNPCNFHTGLLVIKPDTDKYNDMLVALEKHSIGSYDGADQGFLTAYFSFDEAWASPMFDARKGFAQSDTPVMRLAPGYNLNVFWYYEKGDYELYRCHYRFADMTLPGMTLTYPTPTPLKPWYYLPYLWLDVNYDVWLRIRMSLPDQQYGTETMMHLAVSSVILLAILYAFHRYSKIVDRLVFAMIAICAKIKTWKMINTNVVGVTSGTIAASIAVFFPYYCVIPSTFPPGHAWGLGFFYLHAIAFLSVMFVNMVLVIKVKGSSSETTFASWTLNDRRKEIQRQFLELIRVGLWKLFPVFLIIVAVANVCYFRLYPITSFHLGKVILTGYLLTFAAVLFLNVHRNFFNAILSVKKST